MQAPAAAVARIGATLDHGTALEAVDQPGDGNRLDFQKFGKFLLQKPWLRLEPYQDGPLGPCHAVRTGALVCLGADEPREIDDVGEKLAFALHAFER